MESQSSFYAYRIPDAMLKKSIRFSLTTRPICLEADHGEIYDPSRSKRKGTSGRFTAAQTC